MRYLPLRIAALMPACAALLALSAAGAEDFKPLYNGRTLDGWHVKDAVNGAQVWRADGEILRVEKGPLGAGGWLASDREYGDFILRLEWRLPPGGNSGVGLRYPADDEPAHMGVEIQLLDDAAPANAQRPPEELSGSLYAEAAPLRRADKPVGEWNTTEISCIGSELVVRTNGVETLRLDLSRLTVLHGHHPHYKPVSERPRRGFIGLQGDRGEPAEFRNIVIKEL